MKLRTNRTLIRIKETPYRLKKFTKALLLSNTTSKLTLTQNL